MWLLLRHCLIYTALTFPAMRCPILGSATLEISSAASLDDCELARVLLSSNQNGSSRFHLLTFRYGEARHPGPHLDAPSEIMEVTISISNPAGVRNKEKLILDAGPGIWTMAETHLTEATSKTRGSTLQWLVDTNARSDVHLGPPRLSDPTHFGQAVGLVSAMSRTIPNDLWPWHGLKNNGTPLESWLHSTGFMLSR